MTAAMSHPAVFFDGMLLFILFCIAALMLFSVAFGALAIKYRRQNDRMAARWARLEAEWEPLVVAVLDGDRTAEDMAAHVDRKDRLYFVDFLTRFAKRLRGETRDQLDALALPYLDAVGAHLTYPAPAQRARAVQALGLLGFTHFADRLVTALDDESPLVAMLAARALSRRDHPQYVGAVIDRLYRFDNWSPRFLASMLAAVGPDAVPQLRTAYADSARPPQTRAVAAEALRWLNDIPAVDIAARVLEEEFERERPGDAPPTPANREETAGDDALNARRDLAASSLRLLRNLGRPEHARKARDLCASPDFVVRAFALRALGRIGDASDVSRLEGALEDESVWVVLHAAHALRELGAETKLRDIAARPHPRADIARQVLAEGVGS